MSSSRIKQTVGKIQISYPLSESPFEAFSSDESGKEEKEILFLKTIEGLKQGHSKERVRTDFTDVSVIPLSHLTSW